MGRRVFATPVGAVPQVLRDKETGFLVRDNSPDCLAEAIVAALEYPHLRHIAGNARALVQREFQYETVPRDVARRDLRWGKLII